MKFLPRFSFAPDAIAIVKDGDKEFRMRIRASSAEADPLSEPLIKLECVFDRQFKPDKNGKVPRAMRKEKVIYAPPATVVLLEDGTNTVVKCDERDTYDAKYGLALCYMKKALGNTSRAMNDVLHGEAISDD